MRQLKAITSLSLQEAVRRIAARDRRVVGTYRFRSDGRKNLRSPFTDVDLAVVVWPYDKFSTADVSLSLPPKFDVTILNEAPPFIVASVFKHGKLLSCRKRRTLSTATMRLTAPVRRYHHFLTRQGVL
jgi:predicted nucleotidyltransferase